MAPAFVPRRLRDAAAITDPFGAHHAPGRCAFDSHHRDALPCLRGCGRSLMTRTIDPARSAVRVVKVRSRGALT